MFWFAGATQNTGYKSTVKTKIIVTILPHTYMHNILNMPPPKKNLFNRSYNELSEILEI
jgi:hypothetical protein